MQKWKSKQFWKSGNSSVMSYLAMTSLMMLILFMFMRNFLVYTNIGKTQIYADLIADGTCYIGDNGWGLVESNARFAKKTLETYNKGYFEDITVSDAEESFRIYVTDDKGKEDLSGDHDRGSSYNNTVSATAAMEMELEGIDGTQTSVSASRKGTTKLNYSGGLKIVREAYSHTYQFNPATQTPYVWGGGHGDGSLGCFASGADCSGFVSAVYRKCGFTSIVGSSCTGGLELCGKTVANGAGADVYEKARPGDICLWWWNGTEDGTSNHVGIYAGKYKGKHYVIHSRGTSRMTPQTAGRGERWGVHITEIPYHAKRVKIQRIVNSDAQGEEVPQISFAGLTPNQTVIVNALFEAGYSASEVSGICGNWMVESMMDPIMREGKYGSLYFHSIAYAQKIKQSVYGSSGQEYHPYGTSYTKDDFINEGHGLMGHIGSEGYGLGQWTTTVWTNPYADRKATLWDTAVEMGSDVTDVWVQLAHAMKEMQSPMYGLYPGWGAGMNAEEATRYYFSHFEMWGVTEHPSMSARIQNGNMMYRTIAAGPVAWTSGGPQTVE